MAIYLKQNDKLVTMVEQPYEAEELLQKLLADYPGLLAGDEDDGSRKWLLVQRELSIAADENGAGRWSIDHLFIDDRGIPTLVEVKRSSNTEIRRQVVGQLLEYAANAVAYWQLDKLRTTFEANCEAAGMDPSQEISEFTDESEPDSFWEQVRTNLAAGKLRLVFVADAIPSELARIVEFLNEQMTTTEVIALEVKQYVEEGGQRQTLVPRIVGRTEAARQTKRAGRDPQFKTIDDLKAYVSDEAVRSFIESVPRRLGELFPDAEVRIGIPGSGQSAMRVRGKARVQWWYAKRWMYAWSQYRFDGDEEFLKSRLSKPDEVRPGETVGTGEWGGIRFHIMNDADLQVFEEFAQRILSEVSA